MMLMRGFLMVWVEELMSWRGDELMIGNGCWKMEYYLEFF
jgi:hypothetical protein